MYIIYIYIYSHYSVYDFIIGIYIDYVVLSLQYNYSNACELGRPLLISIYSHCTVIIYCIHSRVPVVAVETVPVVKACRIC